MANHLRMALTSALLAGFVAMAGAAHAAGPSCEPEKLAQKYWAQRGYQDGYAEQDWLLAERTLMQKAS